MTLFNFRIAPASTIGAACLALLCAGTIVVTAQQRIFTNPKPEAHLKHLFPNAVAFSPLGGTPLHFKAFAVDPAKDPSARPIGLAFWTTDLVPQEHGYHGPIYILVGMDLTGVLTGVVVDYHSEPYGYFSVEPEKFAAQFKGKTIRDPFRVGGDVDAVSRASLSIASATRAIRDSSRMVARQLMSSGSPGGPGTTDSVIP
jgi:transcriptional regulator of nitric oxide reductase